MEHWEELRPGGLRFVRGTFPPGTDSFLLASLPRLKTPARVCDLGSGTGLLGLLLLQRCPGLSVTGIEINPADVEKAERCAAVNGLSVKDCNGVKLDTVCNVGSLYSVCMDLRRVRERLPSGSFDLVISNPPYYPAGQGRPPTHAADRRARTEEGCTLAELTDAAAYLLRRGGAFCLCGKPERLTDILCALREAGCEAKRLRFACTYPDRAPSLVLVEGRRFGKPGLAVEPPLILRKPDGTPTEELDQIYFRRPS